MSAASLRPVPAVVTVALGAVIALQSRVNGELKSHVGNGLVPAWLTMVSGLALLTIVAVAHRPTARGLGVTRSAVRSGTLPWWSLIGGVFGALFLITQSVAVPALGVAAFTVGVVAGQTTGSLIVDRTRIGGGPTRAVSARRVVAALLAVVAVGIGVSDRLGAATGAGVAVFAVLAFGAGVLVAPQQAVNGRVSMVSGSPFAASFVNFLGGAVLLTVVAGGALALGLLRPQDPLGAPWWAYVGGLLGTAVIAGAAWVVPVLGVLVFSLLSVFGQLVGALVLDVVLPTPGTSVGVHLAMALGLTALAILVASSGSGRMPP